MALAAVAFGGCTNGEPEPLAWSAGHDALLGVGLASQYYHAEFGRWPDRLADLRAQDPNGWMTASLDHAPLGVAFGDERFERAAFRVQPDSSLIVDVEYRPFESRLDGPDGRPAEVEELRGSVRARAATGDASWVWTDIERATVASSAGRATVTARRDSMNTQLVYRTRP